MYNFLSACCVSVLYISRVKQKGCIAHTVYTFSKYEALSGLMGNMGIMSFISGEQGDISLKMKGTGERGTNLILGNREHRKRKLRF